MHDRLFCNPAQAEQHCESAKYSPIFPAKSCACCLFSVARISERKCCFPFSAASLSFYLAWRLQKIFRPNRLRSYAALAYTVRWSTAISNLDDHTAQKEAAVFVSCEQFSQQFTEDLEAASHEALFCVSSLSARPVQRMIPLLQRFQHRSGKVQVYLPELAQFRGDIQPRITVNAAALQRAGIPVVFCPNHLPNFCVIDQRLVWHGGLNPLGRMPADESSLRMDAPDMAAELVELLRGMAPSG